MFDVTVTWRPVKGDPEAYRIPDVQAPVECAQQFLARLGSGHELARIESVCIQMVRKC